MNRQSLRPYSIFFGLSGATELHAQAIKSSISISSRSQDDDDDDGDNAGEDDDDDGANDADENADADAGSAADAGVENLGAALSSTGEVDDLLYQQYLDDGGDHGNPFEIDDDDNRDRWSDDGDRASVRSLRGSDSSRRCGELWQNH